MVCAGRGAGAKWLDAALAGSVSVSAASRAPPRLLAPPAALASRAWHRLRRRPKLVAQLLAQ
eukprot:1998339-Pyramimonas_sp.AAC.1